MKKWMRIACSAVAAFVVVASLTGCNPKVKDAVADDTQTEVGGVSCVTHTISDTFTIPLPADTRVVKDNLNTDILNWIPESESGDGSDGVSMDTDVVRIEVMAADSADDADKSFDNGFSDLERDGNSYHFENIVQDELGGHVIISADQYVTFGSGKTEAEPRKIIDMVVSDGQGDRVYQITIRGWSQEYRDAVMDEIKLVNE